VAAAHHGPSLSLVVPLLEPFASAAALLPAAESAPDAAVLAALLPPLSLQPTVRQKLCKLVQTL